MRKFITILFIFFAASSTAQTPAFPGAEGGGMYASGGRGGKVYYVNKLVDNETGNTTTREGSLRWCLKQSGAKTILFKVSGIIELTKTLEIKDDVTIAGQTAPGDGICLKNYEAVVKGNNVIIRFIRFRPGDAISTGEPDGIWGRYLQNIILDHCSMGWSVDECASFYSNKNFTMQWCILHEGLMNSIHGKGSHSYGGLWGGHNASFHHNLLIHNNSRNPRFNGYKRSGLSYTNPQTDEIMDFRNNVIYNWGDNSGYGGEAAGKYNVVNNYYRPGAGTSSGSKARIVQIDKDGGTTITPVYGTFHVSGNVMHDNSTVTNDNQKGITNKSGVALSLCTTDVEFECTPVTTHTAEKAFEKVLDYAGASLKRDAVENRLANEARTGVNTYTGSTSKRSGLIDTPTDAKGWESLIYQSTTPITDSDIDGIPDGWLEENYPGKTATDLNDEGYTYLEVYLNSLVSHITAEQLKDNIHSSISPIQIKKENVRVTYNSYDHSVSLQADEPIISVSCYNLQGQLINRLDPHTSFVSIPVYQNNGILIVRVLLENNSLYTTKVILNK